MRNIGFVISFYHKGILKAKKSKSDQECQKKNLIQ